MVWEPIVSAYQLLKAAADVKHIGHQLLKREAYFSMPTVERRAWKLKKAILRNHSHKAPHIVIGIGEDERFGGIITGALLASRPYLHARFLPMICSDDHHPLEDSLHHVSSMIDENQFNRILLVDDVCKRGDTLKNAEGALSTNHGGADVRVAVIARFDHRAVEKAYDGAQPVLPPRFWDKNYCTQVLKTPNFRFKWDA